MPITEASLRPGTGTPLGPSDTGAAGSTASQYAMPDHVHPSKIRRERLVVGAVTLYTWTYPVAFAAGAQPVCNGIAECPAGTTDLINVQIEGTPTTTSCTFRVTRYQQSLANLLGLTVLSVNATPFPNLVLHMEAFQP